MKYKLLCIDIDGTLLDDEKKISDRDIKAIQRASCEGLRIAFITGRMPAATELVVKELHIPYIMACNAGTYILEGECCIHTEYLSLAAVKEIGKLALKYAIPLWIYRGRQWIVTGMDSFVQKEIGVVRSTPEMEDMDSLIRNWEKEKTGPNKILIAAPHEKIEAVHEEMINKKLQDVEMAGSSEVFLEITPKEMNKGTAVQVICEQLGIKKEETIAFGDQELDIPMLEAAGVRVAMGNAIEELKAKADFITKTNNEAGIAYALNHYMNWRENHGKI